MIFKNRILAAGVIGAFCAVVSIIPQISVASVDALSASETSPGLATGTSDQTDSMATSTANTAEVKATRTLNVTTAPLTATTIVVGTCTVTFATTTAGNGTEDTNCTGGATVLTTTNTSNDIARTNAQIAAVLRTLTNVSDTGHGALSLSAGTSTTSVVLTTSGTEAAATAVTFTDGTTNKIVSLSSTLGVIPVAQINTITIAGTVDTNDVFTVVLPGPVTVTYTVLSSDTTTTNIASGLNAAIQASAGYASQAFTSAASTNTVILTAKVAGTGFVIPNPSTTNRSAATQSVTFTPSSAVAGFKYLITINGTTYEYSLRESVVKTLVEGLVANIGSTDPVCTENDASITCTSVGTGTPFTYSTGVTDFHPSSHSGGGRSSAVRKATVTVAKTVTIPVVPVIQPVTVKNNIIPSTTGVSAIHTTLRLGDQSIDVTTLQKALAKDPTLYPEGMVSGYFGPKTQAAVQKFQEKYNIVPKGVQGYGWVGPKTRAKLLEVFGN